jgi:hypothetical protein
MKTEAANVSSFPVFKPLIKAIRREYKMPAAGLKLEGPLTHAILSQKLAKGTDLPTNVAWITNPPLQKILPARLRSTGSRASWASWKSLRKLPREVNRAREEIKL